MVLDIDALNVSYGETRIINELSLHCEEDEILAVLGRNGMGKTTLLKSIAGALEPDSGTITFRDEDVTDLASHERARRGITLIPQGREIFPDLTIDENLQMGTYAVGDRQPVDREQIYEYFPILEERLEQKGGTLSGGQQQMLAIARGMLGDNDLLLVDEPSEGLAPQIVSDVVEALRAASADTTMVLVEQNFRLAMDLADRFYLVDHGVVVEEGDTEGVTSEDERIRRYLTA